MKVLQRTRQAARGVLTAGFTLIELMAVILIIGILAVALLPMVGDAVDGAETEACKQNMRKMYQGMLTYKTKFKTVSPESGVRFFADLINRGAMENTKANAQMLTCPGVETTALIQSGFDLEPTEWWTDMDQLDGGWSTYAGRDSKNFPLRKFGTGEEPLIADDNDGGMNHATTTNVLYSNGDVGTYEFVDLQRDGLLGPDEEVLIVGPDSPVEELRKLSLD